MKESNGLSVTYNFDLNQHNNQLFFVNFKYVSACCVLLSPLILLANIFGSNSVIISNKSVRNGNSSKNSYPEVFYKKGVLKTLVNFTGKHVLDSVLNKFAGLQAGRTNLYAGNMFA